MGGTAKMNAMRSGVVVIGALAFGYISLQLGFKPFLEKAQLEQQRQQALLQTNDSFDDGFHKASSSTTTLSDGFPESDHKL